MGSKDSKVSLFDGTCAKAPEPPNFRETDTCYKCKHTMFIDSTDTCLTKKCVKYNFILSRSVKDFYVCDDFE